MGGAHEVEGAIGRDERDGAVVFEARESNALVELDVFQVHRFVLCRAPLRLEQHLPGGWASHIFKKIQKYVWF
jgi:hypothetical protein